MRLLATVEPGRLQAVEGPIGADQGGQVSQIQHVAEHARHQEEGGLPASAPASIAEVLEARLRNGRLSALLLRFGPLGADRFADQPGAALDRRRLEGTEMKSTR